MNKDLTKIENDLLAKNYFIKISNILNEKCSHQCFLSDYENDEIYGKMNNRKDNITEYYNCYDKCIAKHFESSYLGLYYLSQHMDKIYPDYS